MSLQEKLFELLLERSFLYSEQGFVLASGRKSPYYLDCKKTTLYAQALPLIGHLLWEESKKFDPDAVGGLTLGADPLVAAVCYAAGLEGYGIEGFIVRKEPKKHGTNQWIEGKIEKGMRAVILEDVVTTGKSSLQAVSWAQKAGLKVVAVIALVDRQEGGKEAILQQGLAFQALYNVEAFLKAQGIKSSPSAT